MPVLQFESEEVANKFMDKVEIPANAFEQSTRLNVVELAEALTPIIKDYKEFKYGILAIVLGSYSHTICNIIYATFEDLDCHTQNKALIELLDRFKERLIKEATRMFKDNKVEH